MRVNKVAFSASRHGGCSVLLPYGVENHKEEREIVTGRYTDVLLKERGTWRFIAWAGGDDPKN